jgi:hypothetical protein
MVDQPARPADAARPRIECGGAQQAGRDIGARVVLPTPSGPTRRTPGAPDRGSLPPRRARRPAPVPAPSTTCSVRRADGLGSCAWPLLVRRRPSGAPAVAVFGRRFTRARGLAGAFAPVCSRRRYRPRREALIPDGRRGTRGRRGRPGGTRFIAALVVRRDGGLRVARGLAGAFATGAPARRSPTGLRGETRIANSRRLTAWATWARNASSSGGTSLHGSFEPGRCRAAARCRAVVAVVVAAAPGDSGCSRRVAVDPAAPT